MNDANFAFLIYMHVKRHLLKLDYLFCIVLVCSEPQEISNIWNILNHYSIFIF